MNATILCVVLAAVAGDGPKTAADQAAQDRMAVFLERSEKARQEEIKRLNTSLRRRDRDRSKAEERELRKRLAWLDKSDAVYIPDIDTPIHIMKEKGSELFQEIVLTPLPFPDPFAFPLCLS